MKKEFKVADFRFLATCRKCGVLARYQTEAEATARAIVHVEMNGHDATMEEV